MTNGVHVIQAFKNNSHLGKELAWRLLLEFLVPVLYNVMYKPVLEAGRWLHEALVAYSKYSTSRDLPCGPAVVGRFVLKTSCAVLSSETRHSARRLLPMYSEHLRRDTVHSSCLGGWCCRLAPSIYHRIYVLLLCMYALYL